MNNEHERRKDDVPADIADLEAEVFRRPRPGRVSEQLLWAYALGSLSMEEEDRVHSLMAGDDHAQQRLAEIQASLQRTAPLLGSHSVDEPCATEAARNLAGMAVRNLLAAVGRLGEELAVALSWVEGMLVADPGLSKWKPACVPAAILGESRQAGAAAGSVLQEFSSEGVKVRLIVVKPPRVNVEIELQKTIEGEVQLFRLEKGSRRRRVAGRPLGGGKTLFERCPPGLLEVVLPGGDSFLVAIAEADGTILKND
ncbi:MAG: hypothetical protein GX456_07035 [Verrucomicrobia bacterium]|nr:hypothetical protein [Verrucomicrobiota bacterium]